MRESMTTSVEMPIPFERLNIAPISQSRFRSDNETTFRRLAATNPTLFHALLLQESGFSEVECLKYALIRLSQQLFESEMGRYDKPIP